MTWVNVVVSWDWGDVCTAGGDVTGSVTLGTGAGSARGTGGSSVSGVTLGSLANPGVVLLLLVLDARK